MSESNQVNCLLKIKPNKQKLTFPIEFKQDPESHNMVPKYPGCDLISLSIWSTGKISIYVRKKKSTDINAEIAKMLELFDKDFKLAIISYYKNIQT